MYEPNKLVFAIKHESNGSVDLSRVPKTATIFYYENRWWFELDTGELSNNNLNQRERKFDWIRQKSLGINIEPGPFDFKPVNIQIEFPRDTSELLCSITSINGHQLEKPVQRTRGPIASIVFISNNESDALRIPDGATHYCWVNGLDAVESATTDAEANEAVMLLFGGLIYLNLDQFGNYHVIQINRFHPIDSGRVPLTGPIKWQSEYTQTLLDQNRFTTCSYAMFALEGGPAYYAFINADEEFISSIDPKCKWIPTQTGAFLYLFNRDKSPNERDCFHELPSCILGTQVSDQISSVTENMLTNFQIEGQH